MTPQENYIKTLEQQLVTLKTELKSIGEAIDDPRTDLTMTMSEIIIELKQQLTDSQKQATLLRGMIAIAALHVQLYDDLTEALTTTADLSGVILCDKEPVGAVLVDRESREGVMFYSNDMIPDMATIKDKFELITVYEVWEPK